MSEQIIKEFTYTNGSDTSNVTLIRHETPDTETGITWIVSHTLNGKSSADKKYDRMSVAEMDFKNAVLYALNTSSLFYTYSAER